MAFYGLIILFFILGSIFGWIAFFSNRNLSRQVEDLKKELRELKAGGPVSAPRPGNDAINPAAPETAAARPVSPQQQPPVPAALGQDGRAPTVAPVTASNAGQAGWIDNLRDNWMIWLGGICIGLSGIFLTRYSIEQGYLGPGARVTAGIVLGIALHAAAEWLRRNRENHPSFAALAGGGSITLFAALLAALHLFKMLNPTLVFIFLAIVALATMFLAVFHGPVLAVLGILGAYLVPLLVGEGPGGALAVLVYTLIISSSVLLLMRYVFRDWLWFGMLGGGLGWWLLTISEPGVDGLRGIYLAAFAYLLIAIPPADWLLQQSRNATATAGIRKYFTAGDRLEKLLPLSLLLVIVAQSLSIASQGYADSAIFNWTPLAVLLLIAGGKRRYLSLHPWVLLILTLAGWLLSQFDVGRLYPLDPAVMPSFYWYCGLTVFIYSYLSLVNARRAEDEQLWVSQAVLAPLLFLTLTYVLSERLETPLYWSMIAALLGAFYLALAGVLLQKNRGTVSAWLFIGGHLGYSLAVAMYLREASMTLALAAQIISLSWLIRRFELQSLGWLLKGVVALVIFRLTLNPWLLSYPTDVHWSLWTYGGSTLCCFIGGMLLHARPALQKWAYGATLHLFALAVWAETRYSLYDGNVYANQYDFLEAVIMLNISWTLGLIYHYRERFSANLQKLYRVYSKALIAFALLNYAAIVLATISSEPWVWRNIGDTRVFNLLLLAYGTPVILGLATRWSYPRLRAAAAVFTAAALFIFVTLEIRHLWHSTLRLTEPTTGAELYTYSAVWLIISVCAILGGVWRLGEGVYRAGMLLLVVVIAKLFLVDMSDLEGLLRVASFMGMGLGLLGIAYLHQRLNRISLQPGLRS